MATFKELVNQRNSASKESKKRVTITVVLVEFGFFVIAAVLAFLFLLSGIIILFLIAAGACAGFFVLFLVLLHFYRKVNMEIQGSSKMSPRMVAGTLVLMILLLCLIGFEFGFFWNLLTMISIHYPDLASIQFVFLMSMIIFFGSIPFIAALWYKTSPQVAVHLIVRLHNLWFKHGKGVKTHTMVTPTYQGHSFLFSFKRALTAMLFSSFVVFTLMAPIATGSGITSFAGNNIAADAHNCIWYLLYVVVGTTGSFVLFFWLLPSCFLLDDAGVVFFKRNARYRQATQITSISSWFLNIIQSVVGTSALITYVSFILKNWGVIEFLSNALNEIAAVQFAIFIFGFPAIGTILMALIILLFQESQFKKLKTSLYQELVSIGVDPRLVTVSLDRKEALQEGTLPNMVGENFFTNPPLRDSVEKFPPPGRLIDPDEPPERKNLV
jgi:hypothetical protein